MIPPICPAGKVISAPEGPAVVCGVMERDNARADSILEGVPHGVVVTAAKDPSTYFGFCYGNGEPGHPDDEKTPCHYTGCPVWAAGKEVDATERVYAYDSPADPAEAEAKVAEELGIELTRGAPERDELAKLFGFEPGVKT